MATPSPETAASPVPGSMTREEWIRRYAARIVEVCGPDVTLKPGERPIEIYAQEAAEVGAASALELDGPAWENPTMAWDTPEEAADEEMSNWDNDE
jgi:hypothetical protein